MTVTTHGYRKPPPARQGRDIRHAITGYRNEDATEFEIGIAPVQAQFIDSAFTPKLPAGPARNINHDPREIAVLT
ncbi:MAG: hypothetical protein M9957_00190 [Rhodobacteraceae bacterium]|nr:hypothetical protein [Paracoccaceae bacterium]